MLNCSVLIFYGDDQSRLFQFDLLTRGSLLDNERDTVTEVTRISVQPLYFTNHTPTVLYNQKYKEYEITKNVEISTK